MLRVNVRYQFLFLRRQSFIFFDPILYLSFFLFTRLLPFHSYVVDTNIHTPIRCRGASKKVLSPAYFALIAAKKKKLTNKTRETDTKVRARVRARVFMFHSFLPPFFFHRDFLLTN